MRKLFILSVLGAAAADSGAVLPAHAAAQPAHAWEIGPIDRGRNISVGMPASPTPARRGWYFDFPYPYESVGHVHYVTFRPGSIIGKSRIVMRYRVDAPRGVRFVARDTPAQAATVSLYLQRRGDNWSGRRQHEFFRWFAPPATVRQIAPGEHEITVNLQDPKWVSVLGKPASTNRAAFNSALAQADRIGLVFGSAARRGHGVYATGPARFTLISFRIV